MINDYLIRWRTANHDNVATQPTHDKTNSFAIQNQASHVTNRTYRLLTVKRPGSPVWPLPANLMHPEIPRDGPMIRCVRVSDGRLRRRFVIAVWSAKPAELASSQNLPFTQGRGPRHEHWRTLLKSVDLFSLHLFSQCFRVNLPTKRGGATLELRSGPRTRARPRCRWILGTA